MFQTKAKLIEKKELKKDVFSFWLYSEKIAKSAKPGQFVNVLVEGFSLRRPISICELEGNLLRIVFVVKGYGTRKMARFKIGDFVDLVGPLGNGFSSTKEKVLIIGGGIGVAPLLELQKKLENSFSILGFNNRSDVILEEEFSRYGEFLIYTVDGSYGELGFVTKNIDLIIKEKGIKKIAACGPHKMLESIMLFCKKNQINCEISFEERMGCGIGACLCCQKTLDIDGIEKTFHVCSDGPVISFNFQVK